MTAVLRWALLVIGVVLIVVGLIFLQMSPVYPGLQALVLGLVLVFAVSGERWRYRHRAHSKKGEWQKTGECFEDPETGLVMEVFYNPVSGERHYEPRQENGLSTEKE